jgi:hypothetical protein
MEQPKAAPKLKPGDPLQAGSKSFRGFCKGWLSKLQTRERANQKAVKLSKKSGRYVGEFTGYGRSVLSCNASPTGNRATPLVGRLGYHEIRYRKVGSTRAKALKSKPQELYRIEVMELFRYDGSSWVY